MAQIPDHYGDVGGGWRPILETLHRRLVEIFPEYQIGQIKEKFGGLRVYLWAYPKDKALYDVFDAIADAEDASFIVCERCGSTDSVDTCGPEWIKTLCDGCRENL